jgi:predicted dithiol-disulfide oxidoreductase (DUF899 family)
MAHLHDDRLPNETSAYRTARDTLLTAEMELRAKVEAVAALRRTLPLGGALKTDYVLTEGSADLSADDAETQTRFPELFAPGKDTLIVYCSCTRKAAIPAQPARPLSTFSTARRRISTPG